jgi:hypothetical protein
VRVAWRIGDDERRSYYARRESNNPQKVRENRDIPPTGGTDSGTAAESGYDVMASLALLTRKSSDLESLVKRWEGLPEPIKAAIMALVNTTTTPST